MKAGQSVYSILQGQGVPEGSVQQAVATADLIEKLVIPELITEARFDEVITFRICRQARRLITGKAAIQMPAAEVASLLVTGESSQIGAELDCLCEHGMTIADREAKLVEQAAENDRLKIAAAEAEKLKAAEAARAAAEKAAPPAPAAPAPSATPPQAIDSTPSPKPAEKPQETTATPDIPATTPLAKQQSEQEEAEDDEEESYAPLVIDGTKPDPQPSTKPSGPSLMDLTGKFTDLFIDATDLDGPDLEKLVGYLRAATNDLAATLESLQAVA